MPVEFAPATAYRLHPTRISIPSAPTALSLGHERSYAQLASGWVGWETAQGRTTPAPVRGLTNADQLVSGFSHECALTTEGRVRCWGSNSYGQLGAGTAYVPHLAETVEPLPHATRVALGDLHACALTDDGGLVYCWGDNDRGQLGDRPRGPQAPAPVPGIRDAVDVACGFMFSCARLRGGAVRCWGDVKDVGDLLE